MLKTLFSLVVVVVLASCVLPVGALSGASADLGPGWVLDPLGAGIGQKVLISSDGSEARKIVGDERSPARWTVLGIIDPERSLAI